MRDMKLSPPTRSEIIFCLLILMSILLMGGDMYEMRRVPLTDPTYAKHARLSLRLGLAALASILVSIVYMVFARRAASERRRRIKCGLCLKCGYDLRASPKCCPECGRISEVAK